MRDFRFARPVMRRPVRAALTLATLASGALIAGALVACTGDQTPAARDTTVQTVPVTTTATTPARPSLAWNDTVAGPALFVAGGSPEVAQLVFPEFTDSTLTDTSAFDLARVSGARVDLFTRAGAVGGGALASSPARPPHEEECTSWPTAHVAAAASAAQGAQGSSAAAPAAWTVGFLAGRATAIPLDSVETLPQPDSARLVADVARLASALPNDTALSFRGLPFVVLAARRFSPAPGVQAIVAEVSRKVNQEARPREERILLVAERDSAVPALPWVAAYSERVSDDEETVEASDVLAAVALGPSRTPTLVIGREYGEGFSYALLERTGPKKWRLRWSSAYAGC